MISTSLRAIALAMAAGTRMMTPVAALSWAAASGRIELKPWPYRLLRRGWVANLLWIFALGELVADKLPSTPDRTAAGPLFGRVVTGAGVGSTIFVAEKRSPWIGGILGAAVAGAQTFGSHGLRVRLNEDLPNQVSGVVGDLLATVYSLLAVALPKRRWLW